MRINEIILESANIATAEQVWDYVSQIHPKDQQGGGFLKGLILRNSRYELKPVSLSSIHIPDQEYDDEEQEDEHNDPYNRAMFIDPDHAGEYSQHHVDRKPIVIDDRGYILDGNHRAWAAAKLLNRDSIMAWVPAKPITELGQKQLDPELYEELPVTFLKRIVANALPDVPLRFRTTPEGYLSVRADDGSVKLDIGMGIAGGDIGFNIENAYLTQHQGTGVMTRIVNDAYQAVERRYGRPQSRSLNIMQDRGHGVWQAIAHKLGAEYHSKSQMGENFADGKNPGRKGLSKRMGVNTKASVSSLRKTAKHSTGEKARMAHWLANMKAGRAKARKK